MDYVRWDYLPPRTAGDAVVLAGLLAFSVWWALRAIRRAEPA